MNEDNFYQEEDAAEERQEPKASLDKPQHGIYQENTSPSQGEYSRQEQPQDRYAQEGYRADSKPGPTSDGQGLAIASMILGILSLLLFCTCINIVLAVVAIVLGAVYLAKPNRKKGMAVAGIVTAVLSLIFFFLFIIVIAGSAEFQQEFQRNFQNGLNRGLYGSENEDDSSEGYFNDDSEDVYQDLFGSFYGGLYRDFPGSFYDDPYRDFPDDAKGGPHKDFGRKYNEDFHDGYSGNFDMPYDDDGYHYEF